MANRNVKNNQQQQRVSTGTMTNVHVSMSSSAGFINVATKTHSFHTLLPTSTIVWRGSLSCNDKPNQQKDHFHSSHLCQLLDL